MKVSKISELEKSHHRENILISFIPESLETTQSSSESCNILKSASKFDPFETLCDLLLTNVSGRGILSIIFLILSQKQYFFNFFALPLFFLARRILQIENGATPRPRDLLTHAPFDVKEEQHGVENILDPIFESLEIVKIWLN